MAPALDDLREELRPPDPRELLYRAHVDVPVEEPGLELRHVAAEEASVLPDRTAAERGLLLRDEALYRTEGDALSLLLAYGAVPHSLDKP